MSEVWHNCKTCAYGFRGRPDGINCKSKRAFHMGFCRKWVASVHQSTNGRRDIVSPQTININSDTIR